MLKYFIIFSLISYCYSVPGISMYWYQASLFERSAVTSFFAEQQRDVNTSDTDFLQYVADHWRKYHERWIINKFWAFNIDGQHIDNCTKSNGKPPYFNRFWLNVKQHEELKKLWPSVKLNVGDEQLWIKEFNTSGFCITPLSFYYFDLAQQVLNARNIGTILSHHDIHPGRSYTYDHIVNSIAFTLKKRFHIRCLTPEDTEKQYLLEAEICLNQNYELVNCFPQQPESSIYACDPKKEILYPALPNNLL